MTNKAVLSSANGVYENRNHPNGMRVLILCDSTYIGEDVMYTLHLCRGLNSGGMNPYVLHTGGAIERLLARHCLPGNTYRKLAWAQVNPFQYRTVMNDARIFNPHIIHSIGTRLTSTSVWLANALKIPCVASLLRRPSSRTKWRPSAKIARLILPSQAMRTALVNNLKVPSGVCSVVVPGVDINTIQPPDEPVIGGYPSVAMAGLLANNRGYHRYLQLISKLIETKCEAEFLILGEGPIFNELRNDARQRQIINRMTFVQSPLEWPDFLRLCTISLCIEPEYGGEMPILLSMASGCPVIASSTGTAYDFLDDEKTGILVKAEDDEAFLEKIQSMLANPMQAYRMGLAAREEVKKRFQMRTMVEGIKEIYHSTIQLYAAHR